MKTCELVLTLKFTLRQKPETKLSIRFTCEFDANQKQNHERKTIVKLLQLYTQLLYPYTILNVLDFYKNEFGQLF